jgi:hypothetical protein
MELGRWKVLYKDVASINLMEKYRLLNKKQGELLRIATNVPSNDNIISELTIIKSYTFHMVLMKFAKA